MLFSHIIPPSASLTESQSLFFVSVSPLLPCTQECQYHLSRLHINALIHVLVSPFLTHFTLYNKWALGLPTSLELIQMHSFL